MPNQAEQSACFSFTGFYFLFYVLYAWCGWPAGQSLIAKLLRDIKFL
jgi:hypothetical protein